MQPHFNQKMLKDAFTKWKDLMPLLRQHDAATMIQNNFLNYLARKKLNNLRLRNAKLEYLTLKLIQKYIDKRNSALRQWNATAQLLKCNDNANIIQDFVKDGLNKRLKHRAQDKLQDMFKRDTWRQLLIYMRKASRILGDKGEVMYRTLEDIRDVINDTVKITNILTPIYNFKAGDKKC